MERARMSVRAGVTAAVLASALGLACRASEQRPGWVVMPQMYRSVSAKPYDASAVNTNGQTLMLPPEGTVAAGAHVLAYGPGPQEALRAGRELRNPMAAEAGNLERGRKVYETVCIVCHGPQGMGDGPIIGRFPNPPSLQAARAKALPDGQVFHIITRGQGIMPSHAAQVLPDDRWRVILYLRHLQGLDAPAPAGGAAP